jgi:hypothetical protein
VVHGEEGWRGSRRAFRGNLRQITFVLRSWLSAIEVEYNKLCDEVSAPRNLRGENVEQI